MAEPRKQKTTKSYKGMKDPKELGGHLEKLHKNLYDKIGDSKIKSKLIKKKKSVIPGFTYWFKK